MCFSLFFPFCKNRDVGQNLEWHFLHCRWLFHTYMKYVGFDVVFSLVLILKNPIDTQPKSGKKVKNINAVSFHLILPSM